MDINEFLKITYKEDEFYVRPKIHCVDGFYMSVQGSWGHYSDPRKNSGGTGSGLPQGNNNGDVLTWNSDEFKWESATYSPGGTGSGLPQGNYDGDGLVYDDGEWKVYSGYTIASVGFSGLTDSGGENTLVTPNSIILLDGIKRYLYNFTVKFVVFDITTQSLEEDLVITLSTIDFGRELMEFDAILLNDGLYKIDYSVIDNNIIDNNRIDYTTTFLIEVVGGEVVKLIHLNYRPGRGRLGLIYDNLIVTGDIKPRITITNNVISIRDFIIKEDVDSLEGLIPFNLSHNLLLYLSFETELFQNGVNISITQPVLVRKNIIN